MDWYKVDVDERRSSKFPERAIPGYCQQSDDRTDYLGGIIYGGQWGWMTNRYSKDATLLICSLSGGECILRHVFWREEANSGQRCSISCVEELLPGQRDAMILLAVCLETWSDKEIRPENCAKAKTQIAILSTYYNQVIRYIDLDGLYCSTLKYLDTQICQRTRLRNFDGCLAVGTDAGAVLLCDIKLQNLIENRSRNIRLPQNEIDCGQVVRRHSSECSIDNINTWLHECRDYNGHLAVEVDVGKSEVRCLIFVHLITGFAAGLKDGRIMIYDLDSFHITAVLRPPSDLEVSVERICCVVPPDDPKPCLFILGMYGGATNTTTILHSIHYRHSYADDESYGVYFKNYKSAETCIRLLLDGGNCSVLGCTTASTCSFSGDNGTLLAILSWYSHTEGRNKLVLFDMNQWYKDEMPNCLHLYEKPNFLSGYSLAGQAPGLGIHLNASKILHFISLQRYDEHFYPNSLTFDFSLLTAEGCQYYVHEGLQHRFLRNLQSEKASLFLVPEATHKEIVQLRLLPQFSELNPDATFSKMAIYEEILSVALEHGCISLLKDCARNWIDGSYMCNLRVPTALSLSTLTNWIVKRAAQIKARCSELCQGIFDYGGYPLDERERKELKVLNGQLGNLDKLQSYIVSVGKRCLAHSLLTEIEANEQVIRTVYTYQRVLLFFIRWGLLPEGQQQLQQQEEEEDDEQQSPPGKQPHSALIQLRRLYADRRPSGRDNLYIGGLLRHISQESGGAAVDLAYPPDTLQSIMQLMLSRTTDMDHKHEVLLYLLFDLDGVQMAKVKLSDRFKTAFGLQTQLVTRVKSLWALDHGDHSVSCEELQFNVCVVFNLPSDAHPIPPHAEMHETALELLVSRNPYLNWHVELLVEALLSKGAISDAMSVVHRPPGPLSSLTRLKVLMASKNIPEAFDYARRNDNDETGRPLLEYFFRQSIEMQQFKALAQLCLRESEEELVLRLLRECKTPVTDSVQLILLLQKSKYIEAVSFMDEVAAEREIAAGDSSRDIIFAYRSTMNPVSQTLAGAYFRIRENLDVEPTEKVHPEPLSSQLIRDKKKGLRGGVFQSSALSAHWATLYSMDSTAKGQAIPCHQVPFLRSSLYGLSQLPRRRRTVRPVPHQAVEKRVREQEESELVGCRGGRAGDSHTLQPSKRRRMLSDEFVAGVCDFVGRKLNPIAEPDQTEVDQHQQANELLRVPQFLRPKKPPLQQSINSPPVTILKRRSALESVASTPPVATSTTSMVEAKRFRFMQPTPLPCHGLNDSNAMEVDSSLNAQEKDEEDEEEEEETDEIIVEIEPAVSISDSSQSDEDEFVSPLSTPNVSVASPRLKASPEQRQQELSPPPMAPPAGPQPRSSLNQGVRSESSSGFGSFASVLTSETASHEFVPTVCSSKMGTQSIISTGTASVKISERTTICGEMDDPDSEPDSTAPDWYSSPPVRLQEQEHKEPQMLDTTLGMSTYDVTAREEPLLLTTKNDDIMQVLEVEEVEEEEPWPLEEIDEEIQLEEIEEDELMEDYLQEAQEQAQLQARPSSYNRTYMGSSDDPPQERSTSPSLSLSSEMSNMSSSRTLPEAMQSADAMYSIVIESTGSITTSRSVTHTPTSFLPSDTNVSQNSSPRATRGTGGNGSPRALYRANSLETVDDLDTTKGSLEEEEEDDEDDCVIALDGTRVGGYVARPSQSAPSSSAELFAFKDETHKENVPGDGPSLSVGATATDTSIVILDSSEDEVEIKAEVEAEAGDRTGDASKLKSRVDSGSGSDSGSETGDSGSGSGPSSPSGSGSGSTSASESESSSSSKLSSSGAAAPAVNKLPLPPLPEIAEDVEVESPDEKSPQNVPEERKEKSESKDEEQKEQQQQQPQAEDEPQTTAHDDDSKHSLTLAFSDDEEERVAAVAPVAPRVLRSRSKSRTSPVPVPVPPSPTKPTLRARLRSGDGSSSGGSGTPPVLTPKRRNGAHHKNALEVIDEQKSLGSGPTVVLTRTRKQRSVEPEGTPTKSARAKRATSTTPLSQATTAEPRQLRGISEPPVKSESRKQLRTSAAEEKLPEASGLESVPLVRRTSRRLNSGLSDQQPSPATTPIREIAGRELRPRRTRTSSESVASPATPTPRQVSSEANVPLKKRGRSKPVDDGDGKSKK
ncbi:LOW QUALITY PROTEIN: protein ELYS homolog [Drosophila obscura]|uniref:LOW QUALITY PROTEIN: protein ELYS homolog n=1 Tax=Drosophila obscura TaxID=7282 RepID=UPI001BB1EF1E|nr:LOW QUALITY PROTEIN: protein ELYS homolog [Drosophila obscura]